MTIPQLNRFFFHVIGDGKDYRDDRGEVCASVEAARNHAIRVAYELRHDAYRGCNICITDAAGTEVGRVPIGAPDV